MSAAIGPGDVVEFIGPDPNSAGLFSGLTVGARYIVARIWIVAGEDTYLALVNNPGRWASYTIAAFRPISGDAAIEALRRLCDLREPIELEPA